MVAGVGVRYDAAEPTRCPYPAADTLAKRYDPTVGDYALLFGDVRSIDATDDTAVITLEHTFEMRVTGIKAAVEPSGVVQVYGTPKTGRTTAAQSTAVIEPIENEKLLSTAVTGSITTAIALTPSRFGISPRMVPESGLATTAV